MREKVYVDYASNTDTRRSRTGIIAYLNCVPVHWLSKNQNIEERYSFGSKFIAMKQCCEYLQGLRCKLRMMGIPVEGPSYILGYNQSFLSNSIIPDSTLKNKSHIIAYHVMR